MDIVYTWVNGSELNHLFRKYYRRNAVRKRTLSTATPSSNNHTSSEELPQPMVNGTYPLWAPEENGHVLKTLEEVDAFFTGHRNRVINSRDRESDELRYSMRSLDQYVEWHHGRIIVVVQGTAHFGLITTTISLPDRSDLLGMSGGESCACIRTRLSQRTSGSLTFNTNTIEPQVYKLKNLSDLFVQFNDDYFVNHPTTVSDFVNKWGGATLLHEGGEVRGARLAHRQLRKIWLGGVYHSNAFNIQELEEVPPSFVPPEVVERVRLRSPTLAGYLTSNASRPQQQAAQRSLFEVPLPRHMKLSGRPLARVRDEKGRDIPEQQPKRKRYFLKHAPFVYCKRMFEHLAERYHDAFKNPGLLHPHRHKDDLLMPFIHNAFVMDRPWAGSPKYLPHIIALQNNTSYRGVLTVQLNNHDGCAPAFNKIGEAARSLLVIFIDDLRQNVVRMERIAEVDPVFFALNDGFSRPEAAAQLQKFMASKYPEPSIFERTAASRGALSDMVVAEAGSAPHVPLQKESKITAAHLRMSPASVESSFDLLMQQSVVILVHQTDEAVVCSFLRSLRLGLPGHTGDVIILVMDDQGVTVPIRSDGDALPDDLPRLTTICQWNTHRVHRVTLSAADATALSLSTVTGLSLGLLSKAAANLSLSLSTLIKETASEACARGDATPTKAALLRREVVDLLPEPFGESAVVGAIVFDLRRFSIEGPFHYAVIGQSLAIEDFSFIRRPAHPSSSVDASCRDHYDVGVLYLSPSESLMSASRDLEAQQSTAVRKLVDDAVPRDINSSESSSPRWGTNWIVGLSDTQLRFTYPVAHAAYEVPSSEALRYTYGDDKSWIP
eukprot:CAMPEP_0176471250 /NCGR_PEP_ID=MMETSP0127-20121128/41025_1 /TAXON_ID=938130 /ORGANISM="Platyophrya macrostoma, Strain WH" /LENGTH=834 /DNA_ID=CAMNT_0017865871 /DNA_START=1 /DNA_END=2507 /DNA_ORIENTATION=-